MLGTEFVAQWSTDDPVSIVAALIALIDPPDLGESRVTMLMHEWIKYRDEQLERVEKRQKQGEKAKAAEGGELAQPEENNRSEVQKVADEVARRADEAQAKRLQALISRQQRLPLDVGQTRQQPQTSKRAPGIKETREELIERMLDPTLTLRETATLIGVCPTTVRRYTKRGVLKCFRTPGNQRRFRLSDVLDFIERQQT